MTAPEAMTAPRELVERLRDRARLAGDDPIFHDAATVLSRVIERWPHDGDCDPHGTEVCCTCSRDAQLAEVFNVE